jgi:hypothetical protein
MFVLSDRQNFRFGQTAEGNAILQTDHDARAALRDEN